MFKRNSTVVLFNEIAKMEMWETFQENSNLKFLKYEYEYSRKTRKSILNVKCGNYKE